MRRLVFVSVLTIAAAFGATAQMRGKGGCCSGPVSELKGRITRVQITPGEGMPYVELKTAHRTVKLYLGAMRYLMIQGFNPKVDQELTAKAYPQQSDYVAASVTLAGGKTLQLRDEDGRPVWRGGFHGDRPR